MTKEDWGNWYGHKSNKEIWLDQQVEKEMEEERENNLTILSPNQTLSMLGNEEEFNK